MVARIRRAHGLDGGLLLQLETDLPEEILTPGRVLTLFEPPTGMASTLTVAAAQRHGRSWLLRTEELEDRATAERYTGCHLSVPREELPALAEEEFFFHELIGLTVWEATGDRIGEVTEVYEAPANAVLGVTVDGREKLIPFRGEMIREVDLEEGRVVVELPEGLLDV